VVSRDRGALLAGHESLRGPRGQQLSVTSPPAPRGLRVGQPPWPTDLSVGGLMHT